MSNLKEYYKDFDERKILNKDLIFEILTIPSVEIREKQLLGLEFRAKELKITNNFKRLYKSVQAEIIQSQKQINSLETEFTKPPDNLKLKCKNYVCNDLGVTKPEFDPVLMITKDILVCTHPILPIERLINIDTNIEKVKLAFYKDKKWQTVIAERNTLASKNKILQLANTGIEVNENNAKELITFIAELIAINPETIPCNQAVTHLGWVDDNKFIPYIKDFRFDGDRSFEGVFKDINSKGDYELWKEKMHELRVESETLHFIIAASFASVLIEKIHINPFIVHLWGKSGTGKTVALMIAMSVWGNPKIGHLVKNLNSTNVGLERLSAFLNNIPFAGDELQAIKNKYSDFNELIYSLTQGEGKSRGTVDGGIAEQLKWNCVYITTGEEPITLENSKEGVKNRVIEIEENEPIINNGKEIVNFLFDNYGYAGKEFIKTLPSEEYLNKRHTEIFNSLNEKVGSTGKQTNAIALVMLADEIISKNIFYDKSITIEQAKKYFSKDIDEAERIYNLIIDYFYQNIKKFNDDTNGEFLGTYDTNSTGEISAIYFIPSILKKFLQENNINFDGIKSKLLKGGYIECEKGRYTTTKWINTKSIRTIKFLINSENNTQLEMEMPF